MPEATVWGCAEHWQSEKQIFLQLKWNLCSPAAQKAYLCLHLQVQIKNKFAFLIFFSFFLGHCLSHSCLCFYSVYLTFQQQRDVTGVLNGHCWKQQVSTQQTGKGGWMNHIRTPDMNIIFLGFHAFGVWTDWSQVTYKLNVSFQDSMQRRELVAPVAFSDWNVCNVLQADKCS